MYGFYGSACVAPRIAAPTRIFMYRIQWDLIETNENILATMFNTSIEDQIC
jgi:hypothetical protein